METVRLFHEAHQAAARLDRQSMRNAVIELLSASNGTPDFWHRLIDFASSVGEGGAAIEAARRFASIDSRSLQPQTMYCETLAEFGREEQALTLLQQLPEPDQKHPAAAYLLGLLYAQNGEFAEAENWLRCVVEAGVSVDAAWFTLSGLKKFTPDDPDLAEMRLLATHLAGQDRRRASRIGYAIGKAEWDIGEFDASLDTITAAADLQRSLQAFDPERHDAFVERVIKSFDGAALDSLTPSRMQGSRALFVTGLPRSGTTLVEQILASHSRVTGGGELGYLPRELEKVLHNADQSFRDIDTVPDDDIARAGRIAAERMLALHPGADIVTDKSVQSYLSIGPIRLALPNARIVVVRRDPRDNLLSIYRNMFAPGRHLYSYDLKDLAAYYHLFEEIIAFWRQEVPGWFHEIAYEDLIADPEGQSRALIKACGLDWEDACLNFHENKRRVDTLSVHQVRQPIYKSSLKAWERYGSEVDELLDALGGDYARKD